VLEVVNPCLAQLSSAAGQSVGGISQPGFVTSGPACVLSNGKQNADELLLAIAESVWPGAVGTAARKSSPALPAPSEMINQLSASHGRAIVGLAD
jgi:hypothetical protein